MKTKIVAGTIILAVIILLFSAGCVDNSVSEEKPTYKIGVDKAMTPWESVDENGTPHGISIDLIEAIAENQEFNIEYVVPDASEWLASIDDGRTDTYGAIIITPERLEKYNFVEYPFEPMSYVVIARADVRVTLDDFFTGDLSIAVPEGTAYVEWLKENFGEEKYNQMLADGKIIIKPTPDELADAVLSKTADTALGGAMTLGNQLEDYLDLKFVGYVGEPRKIGFIFRKDDTEFYNKILTGLENVEKTNKFTYIVDKYNLQYLKDTYIVGVDESESPWVYSENGEYTGFNVEMIEWIAEQKDFSVEFTPVSAADAVNEVLIGDIDFFANPFTPDVDKIRFVALSTPYYTGSSDGIKYGLGIDNGNFVLQGLINEGIADFESSGKKEELLEKYGI